MSSDKQSKTEKASSYKLRKAREKGQVARSADLTSTFALSIGIFVIALTLPLISKGFKDFLTLVAFDFDYNFVNLEGFRQILIIMFKNFLTWVAPILLSIWISAFVVAVGQVGFSFSLEPLSPNLSKLNPLTGLQRLVSLRGFVNLSLALVKMSIVALVVYLTLSNSSNVFAILYTNDITLTFQRSSELAANLLFKICLTMLLIAAVDYGYQKWQFLQDQKMSKEEVKEEYKQQEGNPTIKSKIKSIQKSRAKKLGLREAVKSADVVITNPFHIAVAIKYSRKDKFTAPVVVAKGARLLAQRIREFAKESKVEIVQNIPLARALYKQCKVDMEISPDLYVAVAQVLAIVFKKRKTKLTM